MSASRDVAYRIALTAGFLVEAEQDFVLERWRSCVDNAQLTVENAGKAALALFGIAPKTHDPARQIASILREQALPAEVSELLRAMLPDLLILGTEDERVRGGEVAKLRWFRQRQAGRAGGTGKDGDKMAASVPSWSAAASRWRC